MDAIPKITLDNNCIINLLDVTAATPTSSDELSEIIRMALSGKIDIAITTRVEADLSNDQNKERKLIMMKKLNMFPVIGTVGRVNISKIDGGDFIADESIVKLSNELQKIIFPGGLNNNSSSYINKINDIDHLIGHLSHERDVFVTDDKGILKKKDQLKISPGITILSPSKCLDYIEDWYDKEENQLQFKTNSQRLSPEARILLKESSLSIHGNIFYLKYLSGINIEANGKNMIVTQERREVAKWESAIQELINAQLIIGRGYKGEIFEITNLGFQLADGI